MWLGRSTLFWEPLSGLVSLMVYTPCTHGRLPPPGELAIQRRVQRETLATIGERDAELEDVMRRRLVGIKSARLRRAVGELLGICRGHAGGGVEVEPGAVHKPLGDRDHQPVRTHEEQPGRDRLAELVLRRRHPWQCHGWRVVPRLLPIWLIECHGLHR